MSRRSTRLKSKGASLAEDDAASPSSFKESQVRVYKKKTSRKSTGSVSQISSRASSERQRLRDFTDLSIAENMNGTLKAAQGFSSGYSSSEEHLDRVIIKNSTQPADEAPSLLWEMIQSPAQALVWFNWWLGKSCYSVTSRMSLLNVSLLSRCTSRVKKTILLIVILVFLIFGLWYVFQSNLLSHFKGAMHLSPVRLIDDPGNPDGMDVMDHVSLSEMKIKLAKIQENEGNLMRNIELLREDISRQNAKSETHMRSLKDQMRNLELEQGQRISELKSTLKNLQSSQDVLKEKVGDQQAFNTVLKAEISKSVVSRPELQRAMDDMKTRIVAELRRDKESSRDPWGVGETLDKEAAVIASIQDVKNIVNGAIRLYRADGVGKADFALESAGASVLSTRCSDTYTCRSPRVTILWIPLWQVANGPSTVLQPEMSPGNCWAFHGSQGFLVISLSNPVRITEVTLDHIPKALSPVGHTNSAPKDFAVYGLLKEQEEGKLLGTFVYDQDGDSVQTFRLPEPSDIYSMVELKILSNWGHMEYTCVYRFRVHGEAVMSE